MSAGSLYQRCTLNKKKNASGYIKDVKTNEIDVPSFKLSGRVPYASVTVVECHAMLLT